MSEQRTSVELNDVEYNYFRYYRIKPSEKNVQNIDTIIKKKASDTNPKNPRLAQDLKNDAEEIMVYDAVYDKSKNKYDRNKGGRNIECISLKTLSIRKALEFLFGASKSPKVVLPSMIQNIVESSENRIQNENIFSFDELVKEAEQKGFWVLKDDALDKLMPKDDEFASFDGLDDEYRILNCGNLYEFLGVPYSASENEITLAKAKKVEEAKKIPASNMMNKSKKKAYSTLIASVGLVLQKPEKKKMYDLFVAFYLDIWSVLKNKKQFNNFDLSFDDFAKYVSLISRKDRLSLQEAGSKLFLGMKHYGISLVLDERYDSDAYLKQAKLFIEEGDFDKARSILDVLFNHIPENSDLWLSNLLVDYRCTKAEDLKNLSENIDTNTNFKRAKRYGDKQMKSLLSSINRTIYERLDPTYNSALAFKNNRRYTKAIRIFSKIPKFRDSRDQAEECKKMQLLEKIYLRAIFQKDNKNYKAAICEFKKIEDYRDSQDQIEMCNDLYLESRYKIALNLKALENYDDAIAVFIETANYKDSNKQLVECQKIKDAEEIYQKAIVQKNRKNYKSAISYFEKIEDYKDSRSQISISNDLYNQTNYDKAIGYKEKEEYEYALALLYNIISYKDSKEQITECQRLKDEKERKERIYVNSCKIVAASKNKQQLLLARKNFLDLGNYKDSASKFISIDSKLKARKKVKRTVIFSTATAILTASIILFINFLIIPLVRQNNIYSYISDKNYDQAEILLEKNGDFGDKEILRSLIDAGRSFDDGDYEKGIDYIYNIGGTVDVSYDGNGGTAAKTNERIKKSNQYIKNEPFWSGHDFSKWVLKDYSLDSKNLLADLSLQATYDLGPYEIAYDLNGGINSSSNPSKYIVGEEVVLASPTKKGYTFNGWYSNGSLVTSIPKGSTGDIVLEARWTIITYSINYHLNGGTDVFSNPTNYTIEDEVTLSSPTKEGYTFQGWYSDGKKVTGIQKGSTGNRVFDAKWQAELNQLSVTSEDTSKGSVMIVSGQGYTGETITIKASANENYSFGGWYDGTKKVSNQETYSFVMPASDVSLVAHFVCMFGMEPVFSTNKITYGIYPQTHVSDTLLISTLNTLTTTKSNGWYLYDGTYYAKKKASPYSIFYTFSDGTTIVNGNTYWFKCEPIEWKILSSDNGTYSLVSTVLLDAHQYSSTSSRTIDGKTVYPNNYKYSNIRSWLNSDFYNAAFSLDSSYIQTVEVDNSASTTNSSTNSYACENTNDKVYLLSYQDYMNTSYFPDDASTRCKPTDYAKANGAYCHISSGSYNGNCDYWTRSPCSNDSNHVWYVHSGGALSYSYVFYTDNGVRPAITIKI